MCKVLSLSLVFCLTLGLTSACVRADDPQDKAAPPAQAKTPGAEKDTSPRLDLKAALKDGPYFEIISVHSEKALAVEEDSPKNGAKLIQRTAKGSETQHW